MHCLPIEGSRKTQTHNKTLMKLSRTITNVEEHIKNAFISEIALSESTYRNLKIDDSTIEIKRQLDPDILRQAALLREQVIYNSSFGLQVSLSLFFLFFVFSFQPLEILTTMPPTIIVPLDSLPPSSSSSKKHTTSTEKAKSKLSTTTSTGAVTSKFAVSKKKETQKPIHESDIDVENLPVIQGSFEITKTDADIAQKRSDANQRPASTASLTTSTLKPFFITPASSIKIKSGEKHSTTTATATSKPSTNDKILEMFLLQHQKQQIHQKIKESPVTAKIEKTNKNGETTITKVELTKTTENPQSTDITSTSPISSSSSTTTVEYKIPQDLVESQINKDLPKLDVSLFTSAPVLDNEPWRPINPSPSQIKANFPTVGTEANNVTSTTTSTESPDIYRSPFNSNPPETVMYRNKFVDPDKEYPLNDRNDSDSVFYQSFYNPHFSAGDLAIEKLGMADVKPYPLPVNKIDLNENQNVPDFKPLSSGETSETDNIKMNYDEEKFEHLGGGVIAKKPDGNETTLMANETLKIIHDYGGDNESAVDEGKNVTETPMNVGDIFQELLNLDEASEVLSFNKTEDNKLESRIAPDDSLEDISEGEKTVTTTERLNFMNMKDFIVQMQKNKSDEEGEGSSKMSPLETISGSSMRTTEKPTTTFVEVETLKYTPPTVTVSQTTASQPQLFPIISKWEFVNGTQVNTTESSITKKVFNETLQAVIVENSQTTLPHASRYDDLKVNRTVDKANLQQLSSIFDTLAAKLGIKPIDVASKMPPFSQQNKLKNNSNRTRTTGTTKKPSLKISSTIPISTQRSTTTRLSQTKATRAPTKKVVSTTHTTAIAEVVTSESSAYESSSESMVGQAEVEPVDPTKYEEILALISSTPVTRFPSTTPSLVTLLPVKSNSGIRNFNPRKRLPSQPQPLDETRNLETVVKTSMSFAS